MQRWVALAVAVVLGGCATPQMTAADLAKRADQNMLEAQQNLAGKPLIVNGVVKSTSLAPRTGVVMQGMVVGKGMAVMSGTASTHREQVPLVILQPGTVLCYFEPEDIGDAVNLREGDSVALKCEVKYFETVEHLAVSNLIGCRRSK